MNKQINTSSEHIAETDVVGLIIHNIEKNELIASIIEFFQGRWMGDTLELFIKLGIAFVIYKLGSFIARRITHFVNKMMTSRKVDEGLRIFLISILDAVLLLIVILAVLSSLGFNLSSLVAVFAAAGVAIALALKDSLSNIASGVMIILLRPFKVGDFVELEDISGKIEAITVFQTLFLTVDNKQVTVPNSLITAGSITNYSAKPNRRVDLVIGIGYDDNIRQAKRLIHHILSNDSRVLTDPKPVIAIDELGDSSVNFVVRPWVKSEDYWQFKWDFLEKIKLTFDANGVSIPYPQQDVHIHQVKDKIVS